MCAVRSIPEQNPPPPPPPFPTNILRQRRNQLLLYSLAFSEMPDPPFFWGGVAKYWLFPAGIRERDVIVHHMGFCFWPPGFLQAGGGGGWLLASRFLIREERETKKRRKNMPQFFVIIFHFETGQSSFSIFSILFAPSGEVTEKRR